MIHKQICSTKGVMEVIFELPSGMWADRVYVVGDFNDWSKTETPMRQERDGVWRAMVEVPLGRQYEFRYLIDGNWRTDYHADGSRTNVYGTENSVLDASALSNTEVGEGFPESFGEGGALIRLAPHLPPPTRRVVATAA